MDFAVVPDLPEIGTVFVTGGSGFLGRHCLDALSRRGFRVHAVSRTRNDASSNGIIWHNLDLLARGAVERAIERLRPSHLLHLAWMTTPDRYRNAPENVDWLEASLALLRAFGEQGGQRFVGVGSSAEYDAATGRCIEEATPIRPASLYGQCKAACWMAAEAYARRYRFSAAWARVFLPYGPGDAPQRLIPSLLAALGAGTPIDVTDGSQVRDFVYVTDIADLLARLTAAAQAHGAYNLGTGRGVPVRQVIEWAAARLHARELVRFGARPPRDDEPPALVADTGKAERVLDWRAPTSIEVGLERLLQGTGQSSPALSG
ncbi:MAG TPA: NAD(P)-dependent oxidoreductase [Xanthobacteraceae bacterium]|jgi:nucleoside-diphosphate-sugar epimerase